MKYKLIALILALATASWAQTSASSPSTPPDAKCACCDKQSSTSTSASADHKHACNHARPGAKDGKEAMSCCAAKDAPACCNTKDGKGCGKMANASNGGGDKCGAGCEKDCFSKEGGKTSHNCCVNQCSHDKTMQATPGN